jgi:mono/diheme cytochrome c family protein
MRFLAISIGVLAGSTAVVLLAVLLISESKLRDVSFDAPFDQAIPTDQENIEHGRYIARTRGCFGCHGQDLQGMDFDEQWDWPARAVAPNLAKYAREHDAATLEAAIRQGIGATGKALVSMPSFNFARLSDADTADLIAFLRSAPIVEVDLPGPKLGWTARRDLAFGRERPIDDWADAVPPLRIDAITEPERARGEYLAMTTCNECHGLDLRGATNYPPGTPDLAIVGAIGRDEFERIVRTGRGLGGRHLGLMTLVAEDRFPTLTDQDVNALYMHLSSLLGEAPPQGVFWRPSAD